LGGAGYYNNWDYPGTSYWYDTLYDDSYSCKKGCINLGNGDWGCPIPGNGITECATSSDCDGC
jgi:hypothetical protein